MKRFFWLGFWVGFASFPTLFAGLGWLGEYLKR